jgi:hypothetical protein
MGEAVSKRELAQLKKAWAEADLQGQDQGDLPDGRYQFEVVSAEIGKAGSGRLQCAFTQKVVGGDDELIDEEVTVYDGLDKPESIGWFKRKLIRLGFGDYDLDDYDTVGEILGELPGTVFEGQVKHGDGFMNLYVNKLISAPEEGGEGEEPESGAEEPESGAEPEIAVDDAGMAPYEGEDYQVVVTEVNEDGTLVVQNAEDEDDTWEVAAEDFTPDDEPDAAEPDEPESGDDRYYPTLDELGAMPVSKLKASVFEECGLRVVGPKAKDKAFMQEVAQTIVSIMEDDDFKPSKEALVYIVKNGAKATPAKTFSALEQQAIDWLNEISSE